MVAAADNYEFGIGISAILYNKTEAEERYLDIVHKSWAGNCIKQISRAGGNQ